MNFILLVVIVGLSNIVKCGRRNKMKMQFSSKQFSVVLCFFFQRHRMGSGSGGHPVKLHGASCSLKDKLGVSPYGRHFH